MLNSCARSLPGIKYVAQGFALGLVDGLTACPSGGLDQILDFGFHEGAENARVLYPWVGMENGKITRLKMSWTMHPEKTRLRPTGITISFI